VTGLLKRGAFTILGVAVTLGFWTVRGWFTDQASASLSHIPEKVWDGGGGRVVIEVETTSRATVSASFEENQADRSEHPYLETWQKVDPGLHTFTIEVPANVGGMVEVDSEDPKVGDKVRIAVKVDGSIVGEDVAELNEPLKPGYGFFVQVSLEDYATGKLSED
jgi:hypothetical protein